MKKITSKEIKEIARGIVDKTNEVHNNAKAAEKVEDLLVGTFEKMKMALENVKNNPNCKCRSCKCS